MPAEHGLWFHNDQGVVPVWPQTAERDPECGNVNDCAVDGVVRRHARLWPVSLLEVSPNRGTRFSVAYANVLCDILTSCSTMKNGVARGPTLFEDLAESACGEAWRSNCCARR